MIMTCKINFITHFLFVFLAKNLKKINAEIFYK